MINHINRRQFAHTLGMGTLPLLVLDSCSTSSPEIILHNANIYRSIPNRLKFQAIAIAIVNGKIVAVGTDLNNLLYLIEYFSWRKIEMNDRNRSL